MGLFTSKIVAGVLAGSFTLGGAGLLFTGQDTLDNASAKVQEFGNRIVAFETNENALVGKIASLKEDANSRIEVANASINEKRGEIAELEGQVADLTAQKEALETEVAGLEAEIATLTQNLADTNADLDATRAALAEKTAQYDAKVAELATANETIKNLQAAINYAAGKAQEADAHVSELETEQQKANEAVEAHGEVVEATDVQTEGSQPMTSEEVESVDTTLVDVDVDSQE